MVTIYKLRYEMICFNVYTWCNIEVSSEVRSVEGSRKVGVACCSVAARAVRGRRGVRRVRRRVPPPPLARARASRTPSSAEALREVTAQCFVDHSLFYNNSKTRLHFAK